MDIFSIIASFFERFRIFRSLFGGVYVKMDSAGGAEWFACDRLYQCDDGTFVYRRHVDGMSFHQSSSLVRSIEDRGAE